MEVTVTLQLQLLLLLTSFSPLPYVQSSSTGGGRQAGDKSKPPAEISKAPKKILSPSRTRLTAAAEASSSPQASSSSPSTSSSALKTTKIPSTLVRQFLEPCIKDAALPQKVVTVITEQFFGRVKKLAEGSRIKVLNFLERFHVLQAHDQQRRCVALFRKGLNSEKQAGPPPLHHHQFRSADSVNHYQDLAEAVERGTKTYAKVSEKKRTNMIMNDALPIISAWMPVLLHRIVVLGEMERARLPVHSAQLTLAKWIDHIAEVDNERQRMRIYMSVVPLVKEHLTLVDRMFVHVGLGGGDSVDDEEGSGGKPAQRLTQLLHYLREITDLPLFHGEKTKKSPKSAKDNSEKEMLEAGAIQIEGFLKEFPYAIFYAMTSAFKTTRDGEDAQRFLNLLKKFKPEDENFLAKFFYRLSGEISDDFLDLSGTDMKRILQTIMELKALEFFEHLASPFVFQLVMASDGERQKAIELLQRTKVRPQLLNRILFELEHSERQPLERVLPFMNECLLCIDEVGEELSVLFPAVEKGGSKSGKQQRRQRKKDRKKSVHEGEIVEAEEAAAAINPRKELPKSEQIASSSSSKTPANPSETSSTSMQQKRDASTTKASGSSSRTTIAKGLPVASEASTTLKKNPPAAEASSSSSVVHYEQVVHDDTLLNWLENVCIYMLLLPDITHRRRIYAAIGDAKLSEPEILTDILESPQFFLALTSGDFRAQTIAGKPVDVDSVVGQLEEALKIASLVDKYTPVQDNSQYCHTAYRLIYLLPSGDGRLAFARELDETGVLGDCLFVTAICHAQEGIRNALALVVNAGSFTIGGKTFRNMVNEEGRRAEWYSLISGFLSPNELKKLVQRVLRFWRQMRHFRWHTEGLPPELEVVGIVDVAQLALTIASIPLDSEIDNVIKELLRRLDDPSKRRPLLHPRQVKAVLEDVGLTIGRLADRSIFSKYIDVYDRVNKLDCLKALHYTQVYAIFRLLVISTPDKIAERFADQITESCMEELAKIAREERLPVVPADETGRAMAHIMKGLSISKLSDLQDID